MQSSDLKTLSAHVARRESLLRAWLADFINAALQRLGLPVVDVVGAAADARLDALGIDSLTSVDLASALFVALDAEASGAMHGVMPGATWGSWLAFVQRALAAGPPTLSFYTSGSTGKPQRTEHRSADLAAEIDALLPHFVGCRRIVAVVPAHHIYGYLFTVLLPTRLEVERIDCRALPVAAVRAQLQAGDLLVAHPHWLATLQRDAVALPAGVAVLSSTQALGDDAFAALHALKAASVLEIYGSSETAGIGYRKAPGPFQLMSRWAVDEDRQLLDRWSKRRVAPPDALDWIDSAHFVVCGRLDRIVKVGGERVGLAAVEAKILEFSGVEAVAVRLAENAAQARLKAFIVPAQLAAQSTDLQRFLQSLPVASRPQQLQFGAALPRGADGKLCDW